jgi:hypothetical protein
LFFDYLNALPFDDEIKRQMKLDRYKMQVKADVYRLRKMSFKYGAPVVVATQSKAILNQMPSPAIHLPGTNDVGDAKEVADHADRLISLWMPCKSYPVGEHIMLNQTTGFTVTEDLLLIRVNKQRNRLRSGRIFLCKIDFQNNIINHPITV